MIAKFIKKYSKRILFPNGVETSKIYQLYQRIRPEKRERVIIDWTKKREKNKKSSRPNIIDGVNVVSFLRTSKGIAEAARSSILALNYANIPFTTIDCGIMIPDDQKVESLPTSKFSHNFKFNTNLFHMNPPELINLWSQFNKNQLSNLYNIGVWYWELPDFPDDWTFGFNLVDEVWVATQFVYDSVSAKSPLPVFIMPPCIQVDFNPSLTRTDFGLPENRFLFLCAYDVLSYQDRKNPMAAIEAFKRTFPRNDPSVGLVIKTSNTQTDTGRLKELYEATQGYTNCYFITDTFNKQKFNSLLHLVDAYISLHRAEGFGLIPAEIMSLGKPVIMTKWSGNLDLITPDNCCGVEFKLIPIQQKSGPYMPGQIWADPNIEHASSLMKKLVSDAVYYTNISKSAKLFMRENFSPAIISRKIRDRLSQIGLD